MPPPILPNLVLHRILDVSDPPTQDAALSTSKNMLAVTNAVRRMQAGRLATRPGRFTQEVVPTRTELAAMGIPNPRMKGVFNAMHEDPAAPVAPGSYLAHVKAHADFQKAQQDAQEYGGLQRRETPTGVDVGKVDALQQSHGFGTRTYTDPANGRYEGAFVGGRLHGFGYMRSQNGNTHEGMFAANLKDGAITKFYNNSGSIKQCTYQNDRLHGPAITAGGNRIRLQQEFVHGIEHGLRVISYPSGTRYEIPVEHGHELDEGVITWANDSHYEGGLNRDLRRHGHGTMNYANGDQYVGAWVSGKKQGTGTKRYADGKTYTGMWHDDKPHGQGTLVYPDGRRTEGVFVHGRPPAEIAPQTGNAARSSNGKRAAPDGESEAECDSQRQRLNN